MVLSMVPGQAFHVHAEELVETHQHTVRFLDWDGTQLQSTAVDVGAVPEYTGEPLTRASDGTYEYTFTGWDVVVNSVPAHDVAVTAKWTVNLTLSPLIQTVVVVLLLLLRTSVLL